MTLNLKRSGATHSGTTWTLTLTPRQQAPPSWCLSLTMIEPGGEPLVEEEVYFSEKGSRVAFLTLAAFLETLSTKPS